MDKPKKNKKLLVFGIIAVIVSAIFILVLLNSSINSNVISNFPDKPFCKDIQIPYEEQEEYIQTEYYTETVPYQYEVPLRYESTNYDNTDTLNGIDCGYVGNYMKCYDIAIVNIDTIGGVFTVHCNFRTLSRMLYDNQQVYVNNGNTETVRCRADVDMGEDVELTYAVDAPTKTETEYKDVQRERQVTAYRPVTKYKTEQQCD